MTEIREMYAKKGTKCRPGLAMTPLFITIHNTANTNKGAGALNHASYLRGGGANNQVSWHFAVDDVLITQSVPTTENTWNAGDGYNGKGNRQSIAIEICENPESNLLAATNNAAELVAYLMKKHNIPLKNVVQHNNWSGKNCPHKIRAGQPYNWATFLQKVQAAYNDDPKLLAGDVGKDDTPTMKAATDIKYVVNDDASSCEYFAAPNVNKILGKLKAGGIYDVTKIMANDPAGGWCWVQIMVDGKEVWAVQLSDRSRLETKGPTVNEWYFVQVGAFKTKSAADSWADELKSMGIDSVVKKGEA